MCPTPSDPVEAKIRELQAYSYDDDADSSVQIQALPGSVVNVHADGEPSNPLVRFPKWAKILGAVIGTLAGLAGAARAAYELFK